MRQLPEGFPYSDAELRHACAIIRQVESGKRSLNGRRISQSEAHQAMRVFTAFREARRSDRQVASKKEPVQ